MIPTLSPFHYSSRYFQLVCFLVYFVVGVICRILKIVLRNFGYRVFDSLPKNKVELRAFEVTMKRPVNARHFGPTSTNCSRKTLYKGVIYCSSNVSIPTGVFTLLLSLALSAISF